MDIQEFITLALTDINSGIKGASDVTNKRYLFHDGNKGKAIEFDMAVTTTKESVHGADKSAKVRISIVSADISKSAGKEVNQVTSRIRFSVLPT